MKITLFQGILFAVFGFAAVVGIFVFATNTGNSGGNKTQVVGNVLIWGTLPKNEMQNVLTAATQIDTTLKDVSYIQKDPNTLPAELAGAIATGNSPDLILASQEVLQSIIPFIAPIPLTSLPPATFNSAFIDGAALFAAPNGAGYYGMPFMVDPLVLYANQNILSSNGIAKTPATWEALTGLVPNLAILTSTKNVTRGLIALGTYNNITDARGILSSLFLQIGIPMSVYSNGSLVGKLSGGKSTQSGTAVLNFYTQFADPSKVSYTWNNSLPDSQQAFLSGDLALYLGHVSEAVFLRQANPNLNFSVNAFPQLANATAKNVYGKMYSFMIPRAATNSYGAYAAAARFSGSDLQSGAATLLGLAPATRTTLATPPTDPIASVAYGEALYTNGWLSPVPANTDAVFSSMITSVMSGRLSPDRALTQSEGSLTALLQK